jgi:hypothetical protein
MMRARKRKGFGWKRWSRRWLYETLLELGLGGKFQAKSSGWDENRTFLEGDVLEVEYAMAAGC